MIRTHVVPLFGRSIVLAAVAAVLGPACAPLRLPDKNSGPTASREGVEVAVNRQSCSQNAEPSSPGRDLVEEVVEIQVRNSAAEPLTVQRDAFRLISPNGKTLKTLTWRAADPLALNAGETRQFELRFMTRGSLECAREMRLDPDAGLRVNGRPIEVGVIRFQPARSL